LRKKYGIFTDFGYGFIIGFLIAVIIFGFVFGVTGTLILGGGGR